MDAALGSGSPPPQLVLAWRIQRWGAAAVVGNAPLPHALLVQMADLTACYEAVEHLLALSGGKSGIHLRMAARKALRDGVMSASGRDVIRQLLEDRLI